MILFFDFFEKNFVEQSDSVGDKVEDSLNEIHYQMQFKDLPNKSHFMTIKFQAVE